MPTKIFAPAKVNLTLHITGRRDDGYHLLDSLVVFADIGDVVFVDRDGAAGLDISGPEARELTDGADNLVARAAGLMGAAPAIRLVKNLPVASGIGGGSADAAAVLRGLGGNVPDAGLSLGADVPVCLASRPARMQGIGDILTPVDAVPPGMGIVLVNPRVPVATGAIFQALKTAENPAMGAIPADLDPKAFAQWLGTQRNDLEPPAIAHTPVIAEVLAALGRSAMMARMSGSGATCFGLYPDVKSAHKAAYFLGTETDDWWIAAGGLSPDTAPQNC